MSLESALIDALKTYWGYEDFRPLQREAMQCVLDDRDSLVVMPTGGGKSLCYQVPALCREGLAVVVSPLIALMKDQVDALRACGVPAAALNSTLAADEQRRVAHDIEAGRTRLLYVSPERLAAARTREFLTQRQISLIAIDEAHCISAWGHDFRPDYRALASLRDHFPNTGIHAYTATATPEVRQDIAAQLALRDPEILVGDFRRKNLSYYVARREGGINQVCTVIDRHRGRSGIIYCITKAKVDETAALLSELGYSALPYHAGMSDRDRSRNQEAFLTEQSDIIVATIAFGMGIDKSNVRYVIHLGMPKTLENYQQESGRAGRDGEPAECWLLFSGQDFQLWSRIQRGLSGDAKTAADDALKRIDQYCTSVTCRHKTLVEHFGQAWQDGPCKACDVCLDRVEVDDESLALSQKIARGVLELEEFFGASHTAAVLAGGNQQKILDRGHDKLGSWGALKEFTQRNIRDWIEQLISQQFLEKYGEYHQVRLTESGRRLLDGEGTPKLIKPVKKEPKQSPTSIVDSWEGVDRELFESLRELRRELAIAQHVPAYIIFGDATLRDMARRRPTTHESFLEVHGVGAQKSADYGEQFVTAIAAFCQENGLEIDVPPEAGGSARDDSSGTTKQRLSNGAKPPTAGALQAFPLFEQGLSVEQVAEELDRAASTAWGYLESFVHTRRVSNVSAWVPPREFQQIAVVREHAQTARLRPIYEALHGRVSYERIRIAIACLDNRIEGEG